MADRELSYKITTDATKGVAGIKQFSSAVKKELKASSDAFDDTRSAGEKVADSIRQVAKTVETELQGAEEAAEALRTALGDTADKVDVGQAVADLRKLGLTFDDIKADAEQLGGAIRDLDDATGSVDDATRKAAGYGEEMGKATDATNSFVGNALSELPGVSDTFGPLGEAVGQLTEGLLAGEVGFKQLIAAAGPIAVITAAVTAVSGYMQIQAQRAEEAAARVDLLGESMRDASDDALGLANELRANIDQLTGFDATELLGGADSFINRMNDVAKSIPLVGSLAQDTSVDIAKAMRDAGVSLYGFSRAVTGTKAGAQTFLDQLGQAYKSGRITSDQITALRQAVVQYRDAAGSAAEEQGIFNVSLDEANAALGAIKLEGDPFSQFGEAWGVLIDDMRDGTVDTDNATAALNFLALQLGLTHDEVLKLADGKLQDEMDAATQRTKDLAAAQRDAKNAAAEHKQKLDELFGRIDNKTAWLNLQQTFDDTSGKVKEGLDAWKNKADDAEGKVRDADLAVQDLKGSVADYATEVLGLPPDVVTDLLLKIDEGKQQEVEDFLTNLSYGVTVPVTYKEQNRPIKGAYMAGTRNARGGFADTAEGGPELMVGPGVRFVPAGAAVYTAMETRRIMNALAAGQPAQPAVVDQRQFHITIVTRAANGRETAAALDNWYRVNGGR